MILLCTLNARYIHSALGLRYLKANMEELEPDTQIMEFMVNQRPIDIAETILAQNPSILGLGIYIWNITQCTELLSIIKTLSPELKVVLGGPEISHETELSPAYPYADYVIRGQGDLAFKALCQDIISNRPVIQKIIDAAPFHPTEINLPYHLYSDEDIRQRVIYVEASRGCPFKCEFCLSALDKTSQPFDIEQFLLSMDELYSRGARHFKFVDRTFNLNLKISKQILQFFLSKPLHDLFLHFELIPDRLPKELKTMIELFPAGALQFEIGIQTFNPTIQRNISRKQDHQKTIDNLTYLTSQTKVHLHTDLIAGLPGEDINSFAQGFDLLINLGCQEIQIGILKRLRGTPIIRHTEQHNLRFNPNPPYTVLSTSTMDSNTLFRINRFSRYWDMIGNSGRFAHSLPYILVDKPFHHFMDLSDWIFSTSKQTHQIALPRLFKLLHQKFEQHSDIVLNLQQDYEKTGSKKSFAQLVGLQVETQKTTASASSRQLRHLQ